MSTDQVQCQGNGHFELVWGIGTALKYLQAIVGDAAPRTFVEGVFLDIMRSDCVRWKMSAGLLRSDGDNSFWRRARIENNQVVHWIPEKTRVLWTGISANDLIFYCCYRLKPQAADELVIGSGRTLAPNWQLARPVIENGSDEQRPEPEFLLSGQEGVDEIERIAGRSVPLSNEDIRAIALAKVLVAGEQGGRLEKGLGKDGMIKRVLEQDTDRKLGGQIALRTTYDRYWGVPVKGKPTKRAELERLQIAQDILARSAA